jgi:hypothetical protein
MSTTTLPSMTALSAAVNQARIDASAARGAAGEGTTELARHSQQHARALSQQVKAELEAQRQALATAQAALQVLPHNADLPPGSLLNLAA